jgi:hypothetical protein
VLVEVELEHLEIKMDFRQEPAGHPVLLWVVPPIRQLVAAVAHGHQTTMAAHPAERLQMEL